jgi:hypothetical protein
MTVSARSLWTKEQRAAVLLAARQACELGMVDRGWDVVDLACETGNFFWTGLDDRRTRAALRLISIAVA